MKWIQSLEKKLGKFAIPHIIRYVVFGQAIVFVACLITSTMDFNLPSYICFNYSAIVSGHEFWRIVSFIFLPNYTSFGEVLWLAITLYFTYFLGESLEREWGAFRLNLYLLVGYLSALAGGLLLPEASSFVSTSYIHQSMFLAFATLFPEMKILVFYFIPVKVKWVGIVTAALLIFSMGLYLSLGYWAISLFILICMLNYILFFGPRLISLIKDGSRKDQYESKIRNAGPYVSPSRGNVKNDTPFHRCHTCGITDIDDPNMSFRYCSGCNGVYEYCANHLHNHKHVE